MRKLIICLVCLIALFSVGCVSSGGETSQDAYERGYQDGQENWEPSDAEIEEGEAYYSEMQDEAFHDGYREGYAAGYSAGYQASEDGEPYEAYYDDEY